MNKVVILTDSTADLSRMYTIEQDVSVIPLFIRFEDEVYKDGVDISIGELFTKVDEKKEVARSTGLRSGDFHNAFNKYIKRGYDILYIGIGSNLSSTIQSALIAKQELEAKNIYIVDSKSVSAGLGLLVMHAVELRKQGLDAQKMKKKLDELVPRLHFYYVLSDLDLLYQTSRITPFKLKLAKLTHLKPIVTMVNDRVEMIYRSFGSIEHGVHKMMYFIEKKKKHQHFMKMMITHSLPDEQADTCYEYIQKHLKLEKLYMNPLGCVLGASAGRNAFGVAYLLKETPRKD
ncbi:MAG: hypothetical protein A2Y45_00860 [Tenericutes bacterium GWC2_34_14]|nr:MAG: hypothetical protein A2Y45_00860 [Tenericutes bacterium GWC2_34_14]OHE34544.1 MAG: hypothetical protein A2012_08480 [Tenericutes bacterium GWE2_34_108]OHE35901.1 MAG: hypothetical protein A2Y46_03185 [Tenericutes bacterium GWF1_35_14]OHE39013.1 MAG: hypothetical protein A2Y44_06745 [Tenericutes bacterium GWF2_35_184]OHE42452.1 MAG: hypothetical protein A3K26_07425 [Tenericutes bacterium RIFOXYA12_FULL_35_10]OHE42919.1 MAG: hypothetical protein A2221_09490 [Tenericutes bacterium RIFOXYA